MDESDSGKRAEFGVLFVAGIGKQHPGSTVVAFAGALYGWLFRSNHAECLSADWSPALTNTLLSPSDGDDDGPARATLGVPLYLDGARRDAEWLLAESSWADVSELPRFLDLARWIWKVSTCLLVLQFVIPMRRHWGAAQQARCRRRAARRASRTAAVSARTEHDQDQPGWLGSSAAVLGYLILMGVAAMLSVLLSALLAALAVIADLPIPRIDQAVRWVIVRLSAVLGDSYLLAHCPVQFAAMRTRVAQDLRWLQSQCQTVAVVGHSQGAAIAHQVLKNHECPVEGIRAFITLGQGIAKLHLLQRMDWDPGTRTRALWSRLFVTAGLFLAGLPAIGFVAGRRPGMPVISVLVAGGSWPSGSGCATRSKPSERASRRMSSCRSPSPS